MTTGTYCMVGADETDQTEGAGSCGGKQNLADAQGSPTDEQIFDRGTPTVSLH